MGSSEADKRRAGDALLHGLPGHPLHPPLTDATIGMFVLATALAIIGAAGAIEDAAGKGCWLALIGGLAVAVPTAATGFADWLRLEWGSPPWRTATLHLTAMICAVALFALAAWLQYDGYRHGDVTTGGLIFAVAGFGALTAGGGWAARSSSCTESASWRGKADDESPPSPRTRATRHRASGGRRTWNG